MVTLKLISVGTSIGVVIPDEMLARMKVGEGDQLHAEETADGGYLLTTAISLGRGRARRRKRS